MCVCVRALFCLVLRKLSLFDLGYVLEALFVFAGYEGCRGYGPVEST